MDSQSPLQVWLSAFRLRTLPLAFSSILVGSFIAYNAVFSWDIFMLALITTLLLQVLSNLANDYGDGEKGTDNADRIGPKRAVQAGLLTLVQMKRGVIVSAILALISGVLLIYQAFGTQFLPSLIFLVIGVCAIAAAIKYTMGKRAYGYQGLGDLAVLIFFGIVGVLGSYYLQTKSLDALVLLPSISIGCFATAVLNLNNMRDIVGDAKVGKNTLVVKIGGYRARIYHTALIIVGWLLVIIFSTVQSGSSIVFLFILSLPLFWIHLSKMWAVKNPVAFDPLLRQLALSIFAFAVLFSLGRYLAY